MPLHSLTLINTVRITIPEPEVYCVSITIEELSDLYLQQVHDKMLVLHSEAKMHCIFNK